MCQTYPLKMSFQFCRKKTTKQNKRRQKCQQSSSIYQIMCYLNCTDISLAAFKILRGIWFSCLFHSFRGKVRTVWEHQRRIRIKVWWSELPEKTACKSQQAVVKSHRIVTEEKRSFEKINRHRLSEGGWVYVTALLKLHMGWTYKKSCFSALF